MKYSSHITQLLSKINIKTLSSIGTRGVISRGSTQITALLLSLDDYNGITGCAYSGSAHCSRVVFNSPYLEVLSAGDTSSLKIVTGLLFPINAFSFVCYIILSS
jgi:hypothetical protein